MAKKDHYYKEFINYARFPVIYHDCSNLCITNLIYSPESYLLKYSLDSVGIISKNISDFDLLDNKY